jgi:hypothetical protein
VVLFLEHWLVLLLMAAQAAVVQGQQRELLLVVWATRADTPQAKVITEVQELLQMVH